MAMSKNQFNEKMEAVARILDLTWHPKEEWTDNAGELKGPDKGCILVRNGGYQEAEKIKCSSVYPHDNKGQGWLNPPQRVEIRITETKTPEQIARDIQRRFLPNYLKNLAIVKKWVADTNKLVDQRTANLQRIADHFGFEIRPNNSEGVIYPTVEGIYSIQVYSADLVRLEKVDCTSEQAIKIIEMLKEGR